MKKPFANVTRKQKIRMSIIAGILGLLLLIGVFVYSQTRTTSKEAESDYQTTVLKKSEPLTFKGVVDASEVREYSNDPTMGKLNTIDVTTGQQVDINTVLMTYTNEEMTDQANEQSTSLEKLNLAVANAQENLNLAAAKRDKAQTSLNDSEYNYNNTNEHSSEEAAMKKQEYKQEITQYQAELDAAQDGVVQAQQMLESAQVDLRAGNQSLETMRARATKTVTSTTAGIAYVNEKGRTDNSVPIVQIISSDVTIQGTVTEYDYDRLAANQQVTIKPVTSEEEISGTITQIDQLPESPAVASAQGMTGGATAASVSNYHFTVKPEKVLQYGYNVQITLPLDEIRLPKNSVVKEEDKRYVFVHRNGKIHKTEVTTEERDGYLVVTDGVKEKDRIVANPDKNLKDGQELAVN
ncbi:RND transporter [Enterococcus florum]|uniref:RND transporter n=1 Tax=Enterococcus florum TaxID=2480627 RepID=A0A4P5PGV8_9ENTE|nr:efflux RND transporter periplasmic adaptor subunit [Enterococcus florum]GCF94892.1 RND transporter [Enterococcus florum]